MAGKGSVYGTPWWTARPNPPLQTARRLVASTLEVYDITAEETVEFEVQQVNGSIKFPFEAGRSYELRGGEGTGAVVSAAQGRRKPSFGLASGPGPPERPGWTTAASRSWPGPPWLPLLGQGRGRRGRRGRHRRQGRGHGGRSPREVTLEDLATASSSQSSPTRSRWEVAASAVEILSPAAEVTRTSEAISAGGPTIRAAMRCPAAR